MFETNANADETVSRRSVLKTTGGLIAGSTALAGLGAGRGAAETEEELRLEVREFTEEYIATEMRFIDGDWRFEPTEVFLGHANRFVLHEDGEWVSLPEDTEALANPVEVKRLDEETYRLYFRTGDIDWPKRYEEGEEITLGLGVFLERTVPRDRWDTGRAYPPETSPEL